ncbi:MAG: rhodanese-like domain-containing protein [Ghiorsea sp.]
MQLCQVDELHALWVEPNKDEKDICLVDVRTLEEFNDAHVEGALHIPLHLLPVRHEEIGEGKPVFIICHSGMRSAQATQWLMSHGKQPVFNVVGGMQAWLQTGYPIAS